MRSLPLPGCNARRSEVLRAGLCGSFEASETAFAADRATLPETVNLGMLEGHEVLYLDVMESSHSFRMASQPGTRRPLHCTALGKAILAFLPADQREEILPALSYELFTPHTISNLARLRKDLARTAQQGYAVDNQETNLGAVCVAAPIIDESARSLRRSAFRDR